MLSNPEQRFTRLNADIRIQAAREMPSPPEYTSVVIDGFVTYSEAVRGLNPLITYAAGAEDGEDHTAV